MWKVYFGYKNGLLYDYDLCMDGVVLVLRYTEKDYKFEYGSMTEWLQNIFGIVCIAPLRLCNEISTKIIYLKKSIIERILFVAVFIEIFVVIITTIVQRILGNVSLYAGKVPILLQLIVLAITGFGAFLFKINEFAIYNQLNALLPIVSGISMETSEFVDTREEHVIKTEAGNVLQQNHDTTSTNGDFIDFDSLLDFDNSITNVSNAEDYSSAFVDLSNFTLDEELQAIVNKDLFDDEEVIEYQTNKSELTEIADMNNDTVLAMEQATEESRYIPEQNLGMFLQKIGADNFSSLEDWEVPTDFSLLA